MWDHFGIIFASRLESISDQLGISFAGSIIENFGITFGINLESIRDTFGITFGVTLGSIRDNLGISFAINVGINSG